MTKFLKLVGANTYTSRSAGTVRRNDVLKVDDEDLAEHLLDKGEYAEDGHFRPMFREVPEPEEFKKRFPVLDEKQAAVSTTTHVAGTGDIRSGALGGPAPQAPMGEGPNGAENDIDIHEVDTEMDGVQDVAYHGGPNDNEPDVEGKPNDEGNQAGEQPETLGNSSASGENESSETEDAPEQEEAAAKPATAKVTRQRAKK